MRFPVGRWAAIAAWALVVVIVGVTVSYGNKPDKLYKTFHSAGVHFKNSEMLFGPIPVDEDLYRYSPTVAASMVPWTWIPMKVGALLWRALQAAFLFLAIRAWAKVAVPEVPWPLLALLALPFVIGNIQNGQINPLLAAFMLATGVLFYHERFWLAAVMIAIAALVKVYPLSLGLLLCVVEPRRFTPRLIVVLVIGCLVPFAVQSPEYVSQQWREWAATTRADDRTYQPMARGYHDFQRLLLRWGIDIPILAYRGIQVAAGGGFAALIAWGRWSGVDRPTLIHGCVSLGFIWCTLFGPSTESATYMLLAPIAAHAFLAVTRFQSSRHTPCADIPTRRPPLELIWVCGAFFLLLSMNVMQWFPVHEAYRAAIIPQAHAALLFLIWVVWRFNPARRAVGIATSEPRP